MSNLSRSGIIVSHNDIIQKQKIMKNIIHRMALGTVHSVARMNEFEIVLNVVVCKVQTKCTQFSCQ